MVCEGCQGVLDEAARARLHHFQETRDQLNKQFTLSVPKPADSEPVEKSSDADFDNVCDASVLMTAPEMQTLLSIAVRPRVLDIFSMTSVRVTREVMKKEWRGASALALQAPTTCAWCMTCGQAQQWCFESWCFDWDLPSSLLRFGGHVFALKDTDRAGPASSGAVLKQHHQVLQCRGGARG